MFFSPFADASMMYVKATIMRIFKESIKFGLAANCKDVLESQFYPI